MALRDLIRKRGNDTAASARPAIPASEEGGHNPKIAKIAGIALANSPKPKPAAANDPVEPTREVLHQFRFDLVEADIDAGHPAAELDRVTNMAWEFMQVDGLDFNTAIRVAAETCIACPPAPCEAAYSNVRSLWRQENQQWECTR